MKIKTIISWLVAIIFIFACLNTELHAADKKLSDNWPAFRGYRSLGIATDGQDLPLKWDIKKRENIKWKVRVPGLGHSSPIVWKDRVFLTTAVNTKGEPFLKVGRYGSSPDHPENVIHHYQLFCISAKSGKIIWKKTAHSGIPKLKRHIKSSHANSSAATDGKYVVAFFGSEGLYCYDMSGNLKWKKDFGLLISSAFRDSNIQWGFGSSPRIYKDKLLILCDVNNQSFITCLDLKTGKENWKTLREEYPTWGTPSIYEGENGIQVIVNGYKRIASYDLSTGKEIWWLSGGGDVPVPTPIISDHHVYIANAHGKLRPIYVIDLKAKGNISLKKKERSNKYIKWYKPRRGCYIPTPIVYGKYLYIADDRGFLNCYDKLTGEEKYRERISGKISAYSGSPVIADGKLYVTDEFGTSHIIQTGPVFKLLSTNVNNEICMTSMAISDKTIFLRTRKNLYAIRKKK